ncbi:amino acid permease [Staphylococcus epidermidis]|uniref:amino acid permease n=1 Tax=Staphylococcus epidermidis TaxID=1282 RepID=UPI003871EA80
MEKLSFGYHLSKFITIIVFIIFGIMMIFGILGGHTYGLENYTKGQAPFCRWNIRHIKRSFLVAGFSVGGTEVVAVTAGESNNPEKSMPKAIKTGILENITLYVLSKGLIAAIILIYTDPLLLNGK